MDFLHQLSIRNPELYYFGWVCILGAATSLTLSFSTATEVMGINAYIKPFKFFLSAAIFIWSMAWFMVHLPHQRVVAIYSWFTILVFAFELVWIFYQAAKGQTSHFNQDSAFNSAMWGLMGTAISLMTLFTLYIGILFFTNDFPQMSNSYLWGIRLGILIFVVFAFEGALMGSRLAHTVGAPDGGEGIPLLNWSRNNGDLRIAHFIGMHALQVVPISGAFLVKSSFGIFIISGLYTGLAIYVLVRALNGLPLFR